MSIENDCSCKSLKIWISDFLFFSLLLSLLHSSIPAAYAQEKPEFTRIQDLDTQAKAVNRPVRQKWAVLVGISKFQDKRLDSPIEYNKAARNFYDFLVDPKYGRFRPDHVRLLTDEKASKQSINNSFGERWLGKLCAADDLVLVYLASRSFPTTDGDSYLCAYNCAMDNIYGSCLSIESLMQNIRKNLKADRIVLVLESAYSGGVELEKSTDGKTGTGNVPKNLNLDIDSVYTGTGLQILSSSKRDQLSWQTLFTDNLVLALKDKEGLVSLDEAFLKARHQTEFDSVRRMYQGRKQTPQMKSSWRGTTLALGCKPLDSTTGIPEDVQNFIGAEAHYFKANQAVINNNIDTAIAEYKEAIKADPALADARADYAVALGMKGQWQDAEQELRKAIAIKPDDPLYLTNYARVLDKLGSKEESKRILEKAYSISPKDRVILIALADKCIGLQDRETAMKLIDQALVLYPELAVVQDRMAFLLSMDGRVDEAFSHAKKAVKLDPDFSAARLKLGALYLLRGDPDSAIKEYQYVISKNDANADAHFLLAQAYDKVKDSKAQAEYRKFLELAPAADGRRQAVKSRLEKQENL